ncbi:MAG: A/G-specific adenine glycosylase [Acidimicrobiia bacterium]|nr:MAG: A/G-specific adenine glycosylase [Acidimicrobiia bacterium]
MTTAVDHERNAALGAWYAEHKRDLPWRDVGDPYLVLVSEVMLQQTQASRVVPFYERFVAQFPTVESLAAASLTDLLALWSGLGYNNRPQRLRRAARIIVAEGWPKKIENLCRLPGVGSYTAAAIASFAFGQPVVTMDTNMRRVLSRWNGEPLEGAALRVAAEVALGEPSADWNQAVMDLGASLCLARGALCRECPVADWCAGPDGYVPPMPQARFEGSARQLRGAIVRAVVAAPSTVEALVGRTGFPAEAVQMAIEDLVAEDLLIENDPGSYSVAE